MREEADWLDLNARGLKEIGIDVRATDGRTARMVSRVSSELLNEVGEFACAVMAARDTIRWVDAQGATPSHVETVSVRTGPVTWEPRRYPVPETRPAWLEADIAIALAPSLTVWPR